ncbi:hypothetical protein GL267_008645 [Acidithiobacillus ferrianus]|uniref:Uncharacterized protein n=2 Tax=Acidithiobacillus ferrianus TaxID=2678518 RepID=A0A845U748_9PROT|nr:hypothetical protein [Acidithiobacillus ferrianus]NDU43492.1 hypothetical protein [Acidithiobacillus ferrianus]
MDKSNFEAQMGANFVASEIRRSGINQFERMKKLKAVFNADGFTMQELTEALAPDWKSPEQIEAERLAAEEAAKAEALAKAEAKAVRKAA